MIVKLIEVESKVKGYITIGRTYINSFVEIKESKIGERAIIKKINTDSELHLSRVVDIRINKMLLEIETANSIYIFKTI